ncbi:MAG: pyridoxal-phosphate dependent enzyme [Phycisphaerales bacterium]|nr:pyridoxal-phosphate dependent enzyme [Phycisphaerales bacterium]
MAVFTAPVYDNVMAMVGSTPMVEATRLDTGCCRLLLKLETHNPGNSIKDRIAVSMLDAAAQAGQIVPGGHVIEATAGNTGISLALVGVQRGYKVTVVVPDKMSEGKIAHLRALGADVVLTRSDVAKGHPDYYQEVAQRLADETGGFYVNQFANEANVQAHHDGTGPEIWTQTEGQVDAMIAGVGSGGTITGAGRYLKAHNPNINIVLADPTGSILAPLVNDGREVEPGTWLVEGIGEDFVPPITDLSVVDEAIEVSDRDAFLAARDLLRTEGILAGSSTGTLLAAALTWCRRQTEPKTVVTFVCDHGAKYLSKMFNDFWMIDQGFIRREQHGNLRDLIARRHMDREDFTLAEHLPVLQAVKTMRLHGVSQMAVVENGDVVGILDESDILMAVHHDRAAFQAPVRDYMTTKLVTLSPDDPVESLIPIFESDRVAIVRDDEGFLGLITKIDLIAWLRGQSEPAMEG